MARYFQLHVLFDGIVLHWLRYTHVCGVNPDQSRRSAGIQVKCRNITIEFFIYSYRWFWKLVSQVVNTGVPTYYCRYLP